MAPVEQADFQMLFQLCNPTADRRQRNPEMAAGARETPGVDRSQQDSHRLQSIHRIPSTYERVLPEFTIYFTVLGGLDCVQTRTAAALRSAWSRMMKAIQYRSYGDYTENRFVDLPQPALRDGEVLVAMRTVGINPLDNTFRSGHFYGATPENLPHIGGQTGAGAVVASKSDAFNVGNRVFVRGPGFGIMTDGTWREVAAAPAASLSLIPDGIDDDHAAAYLAGAGYLTGYLALTELAKFKPGQTVLAPGIGGAVGMETVQVARRLGASLAISTTSSTN